MTIEHEPHLEDQALQMPNLINVGIDADFLAFAKNNRVICKFARGDNESIYDAIRLLNGIIGTGLCAGEIERLRDVLQEVVGS